MNRGTYRREDRWASTRPMRTGRVTWPPKIFSRIIDWLYPARCTNCKEIFRPPAPREHNLLRDCLGSWLCPRCLAKTVLIDPPMCTCCGLPFGSTVGPDHLCGDCIARGRPFAKARSVFSYQGPVRGLVHSFKYGGRVELAWPLGKLMLQTLVRYWDPGRIDLAVPVPLHKSKERRRTFNQSWLLLRTWKKVVAETDLRGMPFAIDRRVLVRCRATGPQAGLNRRQRLKNIERAFEVTRPGLIKGKRILLVDDVMTTGATAEACCRCLLQGGAARVDVLVLARRG